MLPTLLLSPRPFLDKLTMAQKSASPSGGGGAGRSHSNTQSPISQHNNSSNQQQELQRSLQQEAIELQLEMERIKERRRQLDEQRRRLQNDSNRLLSPSPYVQHPPFEHSKRSASVKSVPKHFDPFTVIPSEKDRREARTKTEELIMKEEIRAALDQDSTLVGGFFRPVDIHKCATFGRAPRFRQIVGMKGQYYLDNDVARMQKLAKHNAEHYSVRNRGNVGCNVTTQWNSTHGGTAPGPGAYTPRYQRLASKSILA
jgi:hypothetical protein